MPVLPTSLVFETCLITSLRALLFFACRKYLLRNLYHDLQDLSGQQAAETEPRSDTPIEMDTLPGPSPASTTFPRTSRPFHSRLSRGLFSMSFSESCVLFVLLMCQAMDIFHPRTRLFNWNISLSILLASILVLIPLSYSLVISVRSASAYSMQAWQRPSNTRIFFNAIPIFSFLFLLSYIPLPSALPTSNLLSTTLSRLTVVGTVILGLLSGFGAIDTAWRFFPLFSGSARAAPSNEDVSAAAEGLQRVRQNLAEKRVELRRLQDAQPEADGSWFSRVVPNFGGDSQISSTAAELSGLEALEYQMSRRLEAMEQRTADAQFAGTVAGKMFNWGGRLFAIYCVYRVIMSTVNLILPMRPSSSLPSSPSPGTDVLSIVIARMLSYFPAVHIGTDDVALISRQISLALVGVIILSSIRRVLQGVARALRITSRNLGASLMLLVLAQLMGIYLLSTLVQLRTSFPPPPSRPDTEPDPGIVNLFSTLPEYQLFGSLFDGSFLLSAGLSVVIRWFGERISGFGEFE